MGCADSMVHLNSLFMQILSLYDELDVIEKGKTVDFVKNLQQEDGSFYGDKWGTLDDDEFEVMK